MKRPCNSTLHYSIDELWKSAFRDKEKTIAVLLNRKARMETNIHDAVVETFLSDYEGTQNIKTPDGYAFPSESYSNAVICSIQS